MSRLLIKENKLYNEWFIKNSEEMLKNLQISIFIMEIWLACELKARLQEIIKAREINNKPCGYLFKEIEVPRTTLKHFLALENEWDDRLDSIEYKYIEKIEQFVIKNDPELAQDGGCNSKIDISQIYGEIKSTINELVEAGILIKGKTKTNKTFYYI